MKIALIKNGVVENTIICSSVEKAAELFPGYSVVDIDGASAGTGWKYDGEAFTAPEIVKTPEEIAAENISKAQSEYDRASVQITALKEQIDDADYGGTTPEVVSEKLAEWTNYRKQLRAYIKAGDGSQTLPSPPIM